MAISVNKSRKDAIINQVLQKYFSGSPFTETLIARPRVKLPPNRKRMKYASTMDITNWSPQNIAQQLEKWLRVADSNYYDIRTMKIICGVHYVHQHDGAV